MNRRRFQVPTIPTDGNASDRNKIPLGESSTREGILRKYEPVDPSQDTSHNVTFEQDIIDTEDDSDDNYEQSNSPLNNEIKNQLAKLRIPQREENSPTYIWPWQRSSKKL